MPPAIPFAEMLPKMVETFRDVSDLSDLDKKVMSDDLKNTHSLAF
jgi:hypothetical protein